MTELSNVYRTTKGRVCFGIPVGILMLDSHTPFIPGDVGNASSYDFPVRYEIVRGMTVERMLSEHLMEDEEALEIVLEAARKLEEQGVRMITSDCGFMMVFQEYLKENLDTTVCLSSLIQLPFILQCTKGHEKIAVLTASGDTIGPVIERFFGKETIDRLVIKGLEKKQHFYEAIVVEKGQLNVDQIQDEIAETVTECMQEDTIGAILLECSIMPPYGNSVYDVSKVPVYDFQTMIHFVYTTVVKKTYEGFY